MPGYDDTSYGEAFADVYDDWYGDISDVDATIATLLSLSGQGRILELGVGTGRLAVPLAIAARRRHRRPHVVGIDTSPAMLARLAERNPDELVDARRGDMVDGLPDGPFDLCFVAYNTLFNLTDDGAQQRCFAAVAERLVVGGRFAIECFVPDEPTRSGDDIALRTLAADRVVLSVSRHHPDGERADGQFIEFTETDGVRLRPWSIRMATPDQLDGMATRAGMTRVERWEDFDRTPFTASSTRHVTVYQRTAETGRCAPRTPADTG